MLSPRLQLGRRLGEQLPLAPPPRLQQLPPLLLRLLDSSVPHLGRVELACRRRRRLLAGVVDVAVGAELAA